MKSSKPISSEVTKLKKIMDDLKYKMNNLHNSKLSVSLEARSRASKDSIFAVRDQSVT